MLDEAALKPSLELGRAQQFRAAYSALLVAPGTESASRRRLSGAVGSLFALDEATRKRSLEVDRVQQPRAAHSALLVAPGLEPAPCC